MVSWRNRVIESGPFSPGRFASNHVAKGRNENEWHMTSINRADLLYI